MNAMDECNIAHDECICIKKNFKSINKLKSNVRKLLVFAFFLQKQAIVLTLDHRNSIILAIIESQLCENISKSDLS